MTFVDVESVTARTVRGPLGRIEGPPAERTVRDFFGAARSSAPGPQGFLVEFDSPATVGAHFHPVDQFQVFFAGTDAWFQRHPIGRFAVHYADAYSTYGPFGTTSGGLAFFTLRAESTELTGYMPGARDQLIRRGRRNLEAVAEPRGGPAGAHVALADDDGLEVVVVEGDRGIVVELPPARTPAGEYHCVLSGALAVDGESHGKFALGWYDRGSAPTRLHFAEDRSLAVVLRYPPSSLGDPAASASSSS